MVAAVRFRIGFELSRKHPRVEGLLCVHERVRAQRLRRREGDEAPGLRRIGLGSVTFERNETTMTERGLGMRYGWTGLARDRRRRNFRRWATILAMLAPLAGMALAASGALAPAHARTELVEIGDGQVGFRAAL